MDTSVFFKRSFFTGAVALAAVSVLILPAGEGLRANDSAESRVFYEKLYAQAIIDLQHGNAQEKIRAAQLMGAHKLTQYMRPLGEELIKDMDHPELRKTTTNDSYIKSSIAWALGRIGHRWSYPYLVEALEKTDIASDLEIKKATEKAEKAKAENSPSAALVPNVAGPALLGEGFKYPASPDYYWSVADELKSVISVDPNDEGYQLRLMGYNRINQTIAILDAMGEVGRQNGVYFKSLNPTPETENILGKIIPVMQKYLDHPLSSVRGAAALSLGGLGTPKALELLKGRFTNEGDFRVKVRIARAILINDKSQYSYFDFLISMLPNNDMQVRREAALAFRELSMGEAIFALADAIEVEENPLVRGILTQAHYNARIDNILPVNY